MENQYKKFLTEAFEIFNKQQIKSFREVSKTIYQKHQLKNNPETFRIGLSRAFKKEFPTVKMGKSFGGGVAIKKRASKVRKLKQSKALPFNLAAWDENGKIMNIDKFCEYHNLPRNEIKKHLLCTHTKEPTYNITWLPKEEKPVDLSFEHIETVIKKHVTPVKIPVYKGDPSLNCLRIIYTDGHIAMETNKSGFGLYGGVWNEEQLFIRLNEIIEQVQFAQSLFGNFDEIHIIDLGDFMDGWDSLTVRGGHELPQNMDNEKAFDVGLSFKIELVKKIVALNFAPKIKSFNVCNDNHSGSFGYVVNSAAKKFLEGFYPGLVEVYNLRKFISHYMYGRHCFVLTHGKDDKHKKFGFKPHLDANGEDKIEEYIKVNRLLHNNNFITFEKGDSHQQLFDFTTSDDYNYMNYMALSPSSEWVQTNFKRGRSGFNLMVVNKHKKTPILLPTEFEWMEGETKKIA